jgi:protein-tyrosine phosphatase
MTASVPNHAPPDRARPELEVDPLSLIIEPTVPVSLTRREDGRLVLGWRGEARPRTITRAAAEGEPFPFEIEDGAAVFTAPPRELGPFVVEFVDGVRETVAERALPLEGGINFRDIGGYRTADGRRVRWGRLYRSGGLGNLTDADLALLAARGIRLVCDLRMPSEAASFPDRVPAGAARVETPISTEASHLQRFWTLLRYRNRLDQLLVRGYIHTMIDGNAATFGALIRRLSDPANLPAILHCTAGKDRAGMTVAVVLLALGVPEETILADYSLSNRAYHAFKGQAEAQAQRLRKLGIPIGGLHPILLADPATMRAALAHLHSKYGGIVPYLKTQAGIDDLTLERLRENLLES